MKFNRKPKVRKSLKFSTEKNPVVVVDPAQDLPTLHFCKISEKCPYPTFRLLTFVPLVNAIVMIGGLKLERSRNLTL